jgi:hypothetical protein
MLTRSMRNSLLNDILMNVRPVDLLQQPKRSRNRKINELEGGG